MRADAGHWVSVSRGWASARAAEKRREQTLRVVWSLINHPTSIPSPTELMTPPTPYFIAVHAGAGAFSTDPTRTAELKAAMAAACEAGAAVLLATGNTTPPLPGDPALAAAAAAVACLEDWPGANAGLGSSLTESGTVECDASAMAGDGAWGGVGAARGVAHPATVAAALAAESRLPMPLGRVRPIMLAGAGVRAWAERRGLGVLALADEQPSPRALGWQVTPRAREQWGRWSAMAAAQACVEEADAGGGGGPAAKRRRPNGRAGLPGHLSPPPGPPPADGLGEDDDPPPHDTVGAVVVCGRTGTVAAAVSSGGLALKAPGRVGEAAVFGAGCWAADGRRGASTPATTSPPPALPPGVAGVAASVSGVGEAVIRSMLARRAAAAVGDGAGGHDGAAASLAAAVADAATAGVGVQPGAPVDCGALAVRAVCEEAGGSAPLTISGVEAAVAAQADGMAFAYRWEGGGGGGSGEELLRRGRKQTLGFSVCVSLVGGRRNGARLVRLDTV